MPPYPGKENRRFTALCVAIGQPSGAKPAPHHIQAGAGGHERRAASLVAAIPNRYPTRRA